MPCFILSLPPFSWTTSLISCTCPSAAPRDCLKPGASGRERTHCSKKTSSAYAASRFPCLITPSVFALPLFHLHQLPGTQHPSASAQQMPQGTEEEQQPAPATLSCYYTKAAAATCGSTGKAARSMGKAAQGGGKCPWQRWLLRQSPSLAGHRKPLSVPIPLQLCEAPLLFHHWSSTFAQRQESRNPHSSLS